MLGTVEAAEVPRLEVSFHDVVRRRSGAPIAGLACHRHRELKREHAAPALHAPVAKLAASITPLLATAVITGECNFGGDVKDLYRLRM